MSSAPRTAPSASSRSLRGRRRRRSSSTPRRYLRAAARGGGGRQARAAAAGELGAEPQRSRRKRAPTQRFSAMTDGGKVYRARRRPGRRGGRARASRGRRRGRERHAAADEERRPRRGRTRKLWLRGARPLSCRRTRAGRLRRRLQIHGATTAPSFLNWAGRWPRNASARLGGVARAEHRV